MWDDLLAGNGAAVNLRGHHRDRAEIKGSSRRRGGDEAERWLVNAGAWKPHRPKSTDVRRNLAAVDCRPPVCARVPSPHKGADIAAQRSARHQSGWRAERGSSFARTAAGNRCGAESDVAAAEAAIERLAEAPSDEGLDVHDRGSQKLRLGDGTAI